MTQKTKKLIDRKHYLENLIKILQNGKETWMKIVSRVRRKWYSTKSNRSSPKIGANIFWMVKPEALNSWGGKIIQREKRTDKEA